MRWKAIGGAFCGEVFFGKSWLVFLDNVPDLGGFGEDLELGIFWRRDKV